MRKIYDWKEDKGEDFRLKRFTLRASKENRFRPWQLAADAEYLGGAEAMYPLEAIPAHIFEVASKKESKLRVSQMALTRDQVIFHGG